MSKVVARHAVRLMLVVLALGVLGMHTFGHPRDEYGPDAAMMHAVSALRPPALTMASPRDATSVAALSHTLASIAAVPASTMVAAGLSAMDLPVPPMDPLNVCLAILTAVGFVVALVAVLAAADHGRYNAVGDGPVSTVRGRGPPRHVPPLGRRLAALSMLRT